MFFHSLIHPVLKDYWVLFDQPTIFITYLLTSLGFSARASLISAISDQRRIEFTNSFHTFQSTKLILLNLVQLQADCNKHLPKLPVQSCWFPLVQYHFLLSFSHVCLWMQAQRAEWSMCTASRWCQSSGPRYLSPHVPHCF